MPEFIAVSERVSGQDLDALFNAWLYVAKNPALSRRRAEIVTQRAAR
jgi:hypothetical protein